MTLCQEQGGLVVGACPLHRQKEGRPPALDSGTFRQDLLLVQLGPAGTAAAVLLSIVIFDPETYRTAMKLSILKITTQYILYFISSKINVTLSKQSNLTLLLNRKLLQ